MFAGEVQNHNQQGLQKLALIHARDWLSVCHHYNNKELNQLSDHDVLLFESAWGISTCCCTCCACCSFPKNKPFQWSGLAFKLPTLAAVTQRGTRICALWIPGELPLYNKKIPLQMQRYGTKLNIKEMACWQMRISTSMPSLTTSASHNSAIINSKKLLQWSMGPKGSELEKKIAHRPQSLQQHTSKRPYSCKAEFEKGREHATKRCGSECCRKQVGQYCFTHLFFCL